MVTKNYTFVFLFFLTTNVNAITLEPEVGSVAYHAVGDGVWYQDPFPHVLSLDTQSLGLTLKGEVTSWLDFRVGYFTLGKVHTNALATPSDSNYDFDNHKCKDPCLPLSRYVGDGGVHGLSLTLQPTYRSGNFSAFLEGGFTYYHTKWTMVIHHSPEYTKTFADKIESDTWDCKDCEVDTWKLGKRYGFGIGYKNVSLAYTLFQLNAKGNHEWGVPVFDAAHMVSVRYAF